MCRAITRLCAKVAATLLLKLQQTKAESATLQVELCPGGSHQLVTVASLEQYISLLARYKQVGTPSGTSLVRGVYPVRAGSDRRLADSASRPQAEPACSRGWPAVGFDWSGWGSSSPAFLAGTPCPSRHSVACNPHSSSPTARL